MIIFLSTSALIFTKRNMQDRQAFVLIIVMVELAREQGRNPMSPTHSPTQLGKIIAKPQPEFKQRGKVVCRV
jgi:hypothetical protein